LGFGFYQPYSKENLFKKATKPRIRTIAIAQNAIAQNPSRAMNQTNTKDCRL
jgi:hypothetical protein